MARAIALLLLVLASAASVRADDEPGAARALRLTEHELRLAPRQLLPILESLPRQRKLSERLEAFVDDLKKRRELGLRPLFTLIPTKSDDGAEGAPPIFALMARAEGRTIVSFTRPRAKVDPDDRLVFQRLVVSDLFQGRRFSVTVFEDHALSASAARLLGFGARLTLRPPIEILGWRARVEVYGSYEPSAGVTGYVGIGGRLPAAPAVAKAIALPE